MKTNLVNIRPIQFYKDQLEKLQKAERSMVNPLLKDWFAIRNNIRAVERKIREMGYGNNS